MLATQASISDPSSVFMHRNEIYFADFENSTIHKIDRNGMLSIIAGTGCKEFNGDGPATTTGINCPDAIFVHNDEVYFADRENYRIRKIDRNGMIKTIGGSGEYGYNGDGILAIEAALCKPFGMFVDENGQVYFANSQRIRKIDQRTGIIHDVIGSERGYKGDVAHDFKTFPHVGPKRKPCIKPFPKAYHDALIQCVD